MYPLQAERARLKSTLSSMCWPGKIVPVFRKSSRNYESSSLIHFKNDELALRVAIFFSPQVSLLRKQHFMSNRPSHSFTSSTQGTNIVFSLRDALMSSDLRDSDCRIALAFTQFQ